MPNDLNNKKIVVTRPIERSEALADLIKEYNGIPVIVPTLELKLVKSDDLINIVKNIDDYDWIIFTSPAGVKSFFDIYGSNKLPCQIAVIGVKTKEELEQYNNTPEIIPNKFTAEGLLESFESIDLKGKRIALPRTLSARKVLPEGLEEYGATVDIAEAYTSSIPEDKTDMLNLIDMILNRDVDVITFTSPLTVLNLIDVISKERTADFNRIMALLRNDILICSIGPITANALNKYDIKAIEPERYTVKNMIEKLIEEL